MFNLQGILSKKVSGGNKDKNSRLKELSNISPEDKRELSFQEGIHQVAARFKSPTHRSQFLQCANQLHLTLPHFSLNSIIVAIRHYSQHQNQLIPYLDNKGDITDPTEDLVDLPKNLFIRLNSNKQTTEFLEIDPDFLLEAMERIDEPCPEPVTECSNETFLSAEEIEPQEENAVMDDKLLHDLRASQVDQRKMLEGMLTQNEKKPTGTIPKENISQNSKEERLKPMKANIDLAYPSTSKDKRWEGVPTPKNIGKGNKLSAKSGNLLIKDLPENAGDNRGTDKQVIDQTESGSRTDRRRDPDAHIMASHDTVHELLEEYKKLRSENAQLKMSGKNYPQKSIKIDVLKAIYNDVKVYDGITLDDISKDYAIDFSDVTEDNIGPLIIRALNISLHFEEIMEQEVRAKLRVMEETHKETLTLMEDCFNKKLEKIKEDLSLMQRGTKNVKVSSVRNVDEGIEPIAQFRTTTSVPSRKPTKSDSHTDAETKIYRDAKQVLINSSVYRKYGPTKDESILESYSNLISRRFKFDLGKSQVLVTAIVSEMLENKN